MSFQYLDPVCFIQKNMAEKKESLQKIWFVLKKAAFLFFIKRTVCLWNWLDMGPGSSRFYKSYIISYTNVKFKKLENHVSSCQIGLKLKSSLIASWWQNAMDAVTFYVGLFYCQSLSVEEDFGNGKKRVMFAFFLN